MWNGVSSSRVKTAGMSYMRGACSVSGWDGISICTVIKCKDVQYQKEEKTWGEVSHGNISGEIIDMVWLFKMGV